MADVPKSEVWIGKVPRCAASLLIDGVRTSAEQLEGC